MTKVKIVRAENAKDLPLPEYKTSGAAGMDLYANIDNGAEVHLHPGNHMLIPTGIKIELPEGLKADVNSRSGLAYKNGVFVLNSPGIVDSDFRGEIGVILMNLGKETFVIKRGDRIAQLIITKYERAELIEVDTLEETERGNGGFGSTGV